MKLPALAVLALCAWAQPPARVEGVAIDAVTGAPVRYPHISLRAGETTYGAIGAADGHFSISPLAPGTYEVAAAANGYLPLVARPLVVQPDDHKRNLELKLVPAAVISGRVVDDNGDPVEGYRVAAIRGAPADSGRTNDAGEFRIAGLRPGKYILKASHPSENSPPEIRSDGSKEVYYGPTYYPGVNSASMAIAVEARAGAETSGTEIHLVRQPIVRVSGTVTGATPRERWNASVLGDEIGARIQPDGSFTLWRIPPGAQQVIAEFNGPGDQERRSAPVEIVVGDTDIEHVELRIVPPFQVAGRVEEWSGKAGKLTLRPLSGTGDELTADIAASGAFQLEKVQPDLYRVAIADLPATHYIKRLRLGALDMPEGLLDVRGGVSDPLSIELAAGAARVTGTVSDANGPVADALVALFPEGRHANQLRLVVHAKADGTYAIGGLTPGKYSILALPADEPEAVAQFDAKLETVEIGEGGTAMKDLKVTGR